MFCALLLKGDIRVAARYVRSVLFPELEGLYCSITWPHE
jgi:hypothetical protein